MISTGEIYFFNKIKDDCKIVFDVGSRDDICYIVIDPSLEYHLFEPNPDFCNNLRNKLENFDLSKIRINQFGLGNETKTQIYYPDSQSFFLRTHHFHSNPNAGILLDIKSFKDYIERNNIEKIDFLKIDIEGGEPDILIPNADYIKKNVKYVQFEYASTWYDRPERYDLFDIQDIFRDTFEFYFLFNSQHPISVIYQEMMTPIILSSDTEEVEKYVYNQYGFEIAMVRR